MATGKLNINIGGQPNDGTGDSIREAFDKTNQNFSTLFTAIGVTGNLSFAGDLADTPPSLAPNQLLVTDASGSTVTQATLIAGSGVAVVTTSGSITISSSDTLQTVTTRGAVTSNAIQITNSTAAVSTNSAALTVAGGFGVGGAIIAGHGLYSVNTFTGTYSDGIVVDYTNGNGRISVGPNDTLTFYIGGPANSSTVVITTNSSLLIGTTTVPSGSSSLVVAGIASSTSTTTGALQVAGGAGIGQNLNVGGTIAVNSLTTTPSGSGANLIIDPDGVGDVYFSTATQVYVLDTATSTSTVTGALVVSGGIGVGKNVYVGGTLAVNSLTTTPAGSNANLIIDPDGYADVYFSTATQVYVLDTATSTSTVTGALVVSGGVGIGQNLNVGGNITATNIYVGVWPVSTGTNNASSTGTTSTFVINNTTTATNSASGALVVKGGASVGQNLYVAGALTVYGGINAVLTASNANIAGGAIGSIPYQTGPGVTAFIGIGSTGSVLQSNGTTATYVAPSTLSVGTATNIASGAAGSLVIQSGASQTTMLPIGAANYVLQSNGTTATWVSTSSLGLGGIGGLYSGIFTITNVTSSTTSTNGALVVAGGAGIGAGLNVTGNTNIYGNLSVSGNITGTNVVVNVTNLSANSGTFYGDVTGNGALYAGVVGGTIFPETMIQSTGNFNGYMEINAQNINTGTQASTDIVASADNVTTSSAYIDMGITGSRWDGTQPNSLGTALGPNDGYIMMGQNANTANQPGDLVLGTTTSGTQIRIVVAATGTVTTASVAMIINQVNTPSTSTNTGVLVVNGGAGIAGNLTVGGTINGTASNAVNANTATNVAGGVQGDLLIQSAAGVTSFVTAGTNGSVLVMGTTTATWQTSLSLASQTASTSTTTGALTVAGGVGVQGSMYVGGNFTPSTVYNTGTGAFFFGNSAWNGSTPANSNIDAVTGIIYNGGVGSQLFTFSSTPGQLSVQLDGSIFVGDVISYNPASTSGVTNGSLLASGNITAGGNLYIQGIMYGTATNVAGGAAGSLVIQSGAGTTTMLPIGTNATVLQSNGSTATWVAPSTLTAGTSTNVAGGAAGSLHIQSGAGTTTMLPIGSTGYVLQSNGSTATWVAPSTLTAGTSTNVAGGAAGSLHIQSGAGTTTMLPIGAAGTLLQSNGTTATWVTSSTITANAVTNSLTINNGGAGSASGSTYNGTGAITISYNSIGAPSTGGTNATGTWNIVAGTAVNAQNLGGVAAASYLTSVPNASTQVSSLGVGTAASGTSGEIRATGNITAYYSSDARLKENVQPIPDALDSIDKINGVTFDWTADFLKDQGEEDGYFVRKHDVGVIAQEIQAVLPEAVAEREDGYLAVKYDRIVPLLIQAIKELKAEVETLKGNK